MAPSFEFLTEVRFSSWSDFRDNFQRKMHALQVGCLTRPASDRHDFRKRRFIYRGQSHASWPLWSSFDRIFSQYTKLEDPRRIYDNYFREFFIASIKHGVNVDTEFSNIGPEALHDEA